MISTFCPRCDAPGVQAFDGGKPGDRDHGGLLEAQRGGLAHQFVLSRRGVLSERTPGDAKHLIADLEPADIGAGRGDRARHVQPGDAAFRPPEPEAQDPYQVRLAAHQMTRAPVDARRSHPHEDLAGCDNGPFDLCQAQAISGAVEVLNNRLHHLRRCHQGWACISWLSSHGDLPFAA